MKKRRTEKWKCFFFLFFPESGQELSFKVLFIYFFEAKIVRNPHHQHQQKSKHMHAVILNHTQIRKPERNQQMHEQFYSSPQFYSPLLEFK